jgi:hypothetical protein
VLAGSDLPVRQLQQLSHLIWIGAGKERLHYCNDLGRDLLACNRC